MAEHEDKKTDAAGAAARHPAFGSAGGPGQGNALDDLSQDAVKEIEKTGEDHAGRGDLG
ncbi:MAG TPA: hypothetical protein VNT25_07370 [Allosphingosinicella sp.]|nr:hypothetical protein [Allosphingosinicella sp.]